MKQKIDLDFALAYADAWSESVAERLRDLDWRSSQWMTPHEWAEQAELIVPGYNDFDARKVGDWLKNFLGGIRVQPAREGSVALYVKGPRPVLEEMRDSARSDVMADEATLAKNSDVLRLWWD
jgi:hypothetical protein